MASTVGEESLQLRWLLHEVVSMTTENQDLVFLQVVNLSGWLLALATSIRRQLGFQYQQTINKDLDIEVRTSMNLATTNFTH